MVRVLHYLSGLADIKAGVETYILNLYDALDKKEIEFSILTRNAKKGSSLYDLFIERGIKIYEIAFPSLSANNMFLFKKKLNDFFHDHSGEFDFLHMHGCDDPFVVTCAKKNGVKKTAVHVHSIVRENRNAVKKIVKKYTCLNNIKNANYLFACSTDAANSMYKNVGFEVLKNSIDTKKYRFDPQKRIELRNRLGIDSQEQVLCYCGRFSEIKNIPYLLEIFQYVKQKQKNTLLYMIGDGETKPEIMALVKQLGIEKYVVFTGEIENVSEMLSAMDLYIQTSIKEGFSISALEAQCSGLRTVISDGFPKEIVITDLVTRYSLNCSPEEWANKICGLLAVKQADRKSYADQVKNAGYDSRDSIEQIRMIYKNEKNN